MSAKDESYTANVRLCVGDEVDSASSQPQAVDYETEAQVTDISLSVSETTEPSLKIVGTQKVLTNKETLNLTINSQNVDGVDGCTIHATIQQKGATGYSGNFLDANVSTGNNQFGLGGIKEAGSYRLLITVTKDNQELLAVPYYFIVQ